MMNCLGLWADDQQNICYVGVMAALAERDRLNRGKPDDPLCII